MPACRLLPYPTPTPPIGTSPATKSPTDRAEAWCRRGSPLPAVGSGAHPPLRRVRREDGRHKLGRSSRPPVGLLVADRDSHRFGHADLLENSAPSLSVAPHNIGYVGGGESNLLCELPQTQCSLMLL